MHKTIIKNTFLICILLLIKGLVSAQENILDKYIREGLEKNLSLQIKKDNYYQSLQALREAKGLFYPDASFTTRYSRADGGRMIEFPLGDLLNPVYYTLNQLTMSNMFPDIENREFAFLRPKEHETRLRVIQPVFSSDIHYNRKIRENIANSVKADMEAYRRALVSEIKTAYYNHLKAIQIKNILLNTKELLDENIRVNRSLYENDKVTIDAVYRSESELNSLLQQIAEAEKSVKISSAYFNFLLNRDLQHPIVEEEQDDLNYQFIKNDDINNALFVREELKMLDSYRDAAFNNLKMHKSKYLPEIIGVMDYGYQGTKYRFTGDDDFFMASLVLRWDLFKGFTRQSGVNQARIGLDIIEKQKEEAENGIRLQVINAYYKLIASEKKIPEAESGVRSARQAFRLINLKYKQGQASLIEFIDARNTLTNAETNLTATMYDYMISYAEYERAAGLFEF